MKCIERDQDIFMMVHGELPVLRKLIVAAHIRRCPRCQEKLAEFTRISKQIARVIRSTNRTLPKWQLIKTASLASARHMKHFVILLALTITAALVTGGVVQAVYATKRQAVYRSVHPTAIRSCTPGIPSDRCR